jgi:putative flavoprotein involved in K+ transport
MEEVDVVVVGAGQAGLATSYSLTQRGTQHTVLERNSVGSAWAGRWDSFCLVTPNSSIRLPGGPYSGPDPGGFLPRDDIVEYLESYGESFAVPVRCGVDVRSVTRTPSGSWLLETGGGAITARAVVMATGAYQTPYMPRAAQELPRWLPVVDSAQYRNPGSLPDGAVLVVGSGQTGCQIAEELHLSGRRVILACGRAPWMPRRIAGRDLFEWIMDSPFLAQTRDALPSPGALLLANVQASGARGGHDLHYRTLTELGVELVGHLAEVSDATIHFADDLAESVAFGDARHEDLSELIRKVCEANGMPDPRIPEPAPFTMTARSSMPVGELSGAVVAAGYRPDYRRVIPYPRAFDDMGFPSQVDGASTELPGLFFIGTHFLRTRGSSLLMGVGADAAIVAGQVSELVA